MVQPHTSVRAPSQADAETEGLVRVNAPETFFRGFFRSLSEVARYRQLTANLVRKELKVKYKDSVLGFVWSLARPLLLLTVYWIVFGKFLRPGIPHFAFFLFSGLVAWDLFASTLSASTLSVLGNGGLIKKVYFPREILPLAATGAGLFHFMLQIVALVLVFLIFQYDFVGSNLLLIPVALVALVLLVTGLGMILSALNVYFRDIQHLIEVFLLLWFWLTPIVYPVSDALRPLSERTLMGVSLAKIYLLNPMTHIVLAFQRGLYKHTSDYYPTALSFHFQRLGLVIVGALVVLWFGQRLFMKLQGNFAQEL